MNLEAIEQIMMQEHMEREMKYEYAVQWRYKGEKRWFTLAYRLKDVESARRDCERFVRDFADTEARVVYRLKSEWEVVE